MQVPVKAVLKAARALQEAGVHVEIPEAYKGQVRNANGERSDGKWLFESGNRRIQSSVGYSMWHLSKDSKGSNTDGRLSAEEFWRLVEDQVGKRSFEKGEAFQVRLPNGKELKVKKIA